MTRRVAATGTAIFFVCVPGIVAGLIPWLITDYRFEEPADGWVVAQVAGALLVAAGLPVLLAAFIRFAREGIGTPAPLAPTQHLVVGGLYRHVRNPMYVAVVAIIVGQALLFGQLGLLAYAALVFAAVALFVYIYEEPTLAATYGAEYGEYRRQVPAWLPRLRPWRRADPEP